MHIKVLSCASHLLNMQKVSQKAITSLCTVSVHSFKIRKYVPFLYFSSKILFMISLFHDSSVVAASKTELLIEQQNTLTYAHFNASSLSYREIKIRSDTSKKS